MKKLITIYLLNLVALAFSTSTAVEQSDARKTAIRSAASTVTSSHLNSLQSSQDSVNKQQTAQSPGIGSVTYNRLTPSEFSSQPQNTIFSQPTAPTGGYFISVNPQSVPSAALGAGPTPVIMQYLPHNAQQGPIQYLQLIPTRPLIVPISPYISTFNNPYTSAVSSPSAQASVNSAYTLPHHSFSPSTSSHSYGSSYQPSLQNPIGGYSTNYLTYFRPNHGMQIVNGPMDLSLNTNEYIPLQNENSYKMRRT